jgi:hypothetical protein
VTAELAKSDRRQQLGELIKNSEALLHSLSQQDAQIKATLQAANSALGRTDTALSGTATQLNSIFRQAPVTVHLLNGLTRDLASNTDLLVGDIATFDAGMRYSTDTFGAQDGQGYATRISVVAGACSVAPCKLPVGSGIGGLGAVPNAFDAVVGVLLGGAK